MKVLLVCAGGFSTSIIMENMREVASEEDRIDAYPVSEMENLIDDYDVVLVGPQVRFRYPELEKMAKEHGKKISLIDRKLYGTLDGTKILDLARSL